MNGVNPDSQRFKKNLSLVRCECGEEILLLPDVVKMGQAIEAHAQKHALEERDHDLAKALFERIQTLLIEQTLSLASETKENSKLKKSHKSQE